MPGEPVLDILDSTCVHHECDKYINTCGTMHQKEVGVTDSCGCRLHCGHQGPHEFVSDEGQVIQWETDWDCDCDHCMSGEGDFCTVYWCIETAA